MSDDLIHDPKGGMPRLLEIMRRLRDPDTRCPWDLEQTFATIAPYTIEEAYEVADAIDRAAWDELKGELGDLLFQSVFHAQMADEAGLFTFDEVANAMSDKMVARHPHVFGDESRDKSADQQTRDWEAIKAAERAARAESGVLDGVALGLPALLRAVKLQKRAARAGSTGPPPTRSWTRWPRKWTNCAGPGTATSGSRNSATCCSSWRTSAGTWGSTPKRRCARPTRNSHAGSGPSRPRLRRGRRPEDSDLAEMDGLWDAAKAAEKAEKAGK